MSELYNTTPAHATKIRSRMLAMAAAGVSIIPIDHTTKQPAIWLLPVGDDGKRHWSPYAEAIADTATIERWLDDEIQAYAMVGGKISGGLVILDFDYESERFYPTWCGQVGSLADGLPVQQTGKGYHVAFRCGDPIGNEVLARVPDDSAKDGRRPAIETRGEGGYAVGPDSLHPSGRTYTEISGDFLNIPIIPQAQADALIAAARKLDEAPHTRAQMEKLAANARERHARRDFYSGVSVIKTFNDARDIGAMLEQAGYIPRGAGRYTRPEGKSPSVSVKDGRSCHFSSNDPLNDGEHNGIGCHDAFDVFRILDHGGDLKAATRAAAQLLGMAHMSDDDVEVAMRRLNRDQAGQGSTTLPPAAAATEAAEPKQQPQTTPPAATAPPVSMMPEPALIVLADIETASVRWFWPARIALGKITLIVGDPGLGKSFLTCYLSAAVSRGLAWPDDPGSAAPLGDVILLNAEDDAADTIKPRLVAACADCRRIVVLQGIKRTDPKSRQSAVAHFSLERDIPMLRRAIQFRPETRLVVIDPISAYLGKTDSHNNSEVRGLLAPLSAMAAESGVAIVLVSHLNKSGGGRAVYRTTGSLAFPAAARAVWAVAKDKEDTTGERRLLVCVKNNLAKDPGGLAYRITDGRIEWEAGAVQMSADDALEGSAERPGPAPAARAAAEEWLRDLLAAGGMPVAKIQEAAKDAGLSWSGAVRRARESLGIRPFKGAFGEGWVWRLPEGAHEGAQRDPHSHNLHNSHNLHTFVEKATHINTFPPHEGRRCAGSEPQEQPAHLRLIPEETDPYERLEREALTDPSTN